MFLVRRAPYGELRTGSFVQGALRGVDRIDQIDLISPPFIKGFYARLFEHKEEVMFGQTVVLRHKDVAALISTFAEGAY